MPKNGMPKLILIYPSGKTFDEDISEEKADEIVLKILKGQLS